jgi:hypothetical protein
VSQLLQQDMIPENEKGYEFLDPAFEKWFRENYIKG